MAFLAHWRGRDAFVVLDLEFGDGAAFLTVRQAWLADPARPARLHYLGRAVSMPASMPMMLPAILRDAAPCLVNGLQRIFFDDGHVVLDLAIGPAASELAQLDARVDAFLGDAPEVAATRLARLAVAGATFDGAGLDESRLRELAAVGFSVASPSQPAYLVFSTRRPPAPRAALSEQRGVDDGIDRGVDRRGIDRRAIIIGAGLAGAAACERLAARGWAVSLIERHAAPAQAASGNLAGIFMPQLASDDNPAARLSRAAFLFALRQWAQLGGVGAAFPGAVCGVLQLARDADHARVQRTIANAANLPPHFARWLDADTASSLLGAPALDGGWLFEKGGWAHPGGVCDAMLAACGPRLQRLFSRAALRLQRDAGEWRVVDADGLFIASAPTVILANGADARAFEQAAGLPLTAVRGQVTHLAEGALAAPPLVVCREAYLTPPSRGVTSVGATYDSDGETGLRMASQRDNLARVAAILGVVPPEAPLAGRTGFRCVAPDRLPLVGALPDLAGAVAERGSGRSIERLRDVPRHPGLYGLLGYASRGLIWAPLAAELLAAQLEGEPMPLEAGLVAALDPARFLLKQLRRGDTRLTDSA